MELELLKWGDGTIRLAWWDSLEGHDRIFVLREDGTAAESDHSEEEEHLTPIDLVAVLRQMATEER